MGIWELSGVMKKPDFAEFKKLLEALQARLQGDVLQLASEALGGDGGAESKSPTHMAELGTETYEQDFALSLVVNEQETLVEITAALERVHLGTFGQCEGCLKDGKSVTQATIPKDRLRVIPYARYCVACARAMEGSPP